jgi:hypothetical protein
MAAMPNATPTLPEATSGDASITRRKGDGDDEANIGTRIRWSGKALGIRGLIEVEERDGKLSMFVCRKIKLLSVLERTRSTVMTFTTIVLTPAMRGTMCLMTAGLVTRNRNRNRLEEASHNSNQCSASYAVLATADVGKSGALIGRHDPLGERKDEVLRKHGLPLLMVITQCLD